MIITAYFQYPDGQEMILSLSFNDWFGYLKYGAKRIGAQRPFNVYIESSGIPNQEQELFKWLGNTKHPHGDVRFKQLSEEKTRASIGLMPWVHTKEEASKQVCNWRDEHVKKEAKKNHSK